MQSPLPLRPRHLGVPEKASRQDSRARNSRICLQIIASRETTSRAEVARLTALTRATVSSIVGDLIEDGLVQEAGVGAPTGGKPPTLIELNASGRSIVVLDLGCAPFVGVVTDLRGKELVRIELRGVTSGKEAIDTISELAAKLVELAPDPVLGIGIATPGIVNERGDILAAANLGWQNVELGERLRTLTGLPVLVANDSHVAAVAMRHRLRDQNHEVLLINISGGVGAGIVLDGKLHLGTHGAAGEIGHVVVDPEGQECGCGNRGCLETFASAPAIYRTICGTESTNRDDLTWDALALTETFGTKHVRDSITDAGRRIGEVTATLVNALDVSQVVLWTRIRNASDILVESVSDALIPRVLPTMRPDLTVSATDESDLLTGGVVAMVVSNELGLTV